MPLGVCAGADVALGVPEVPDVHVTSKADAALLAVAVVHLDLGGPRGHQEGIPCTPLHNWYMPEGGWQQAWALSGVGPGMGPLHTSVREESLEWV